MGRVVVLASLAVFCLVTGHSGVVSGYRHYGRGRTPQRNEVDLAEVNTNVNDLKETVNRVEDKVDVIMESEGLQRPEDMRFVPILAIENATGLTLPDNSIQFEIHFEVANDVQLVDVVARHGHSVIQRESFEFIQGSGKNTGVVSITLQEQGKLLVTLAFTMPNEGCKVKWFLGLEPGVQSQTVRVPIYVPLRVPNKGPLTYTQNGHVKVNVAVTPATDPESLRLDIESYNGANDIVEYHMIMTGNRIVDVKKHRFYTGYSFDVPAFDVNATGFSSLTLYKTLQTPLLHRLIATFYINIRPDSQPDVYPEGLITASINMDFSMYDESTNSSSIQISCSAKGNHLQEIELYQGIMDLNLTEISSFAPLTPTETTMSTYQGLVTHTSSMPSGDVASRTVNRCIVTDGNGHSVSTEKSWAEMMSYRRYMSYI